MITRNCYNIMRKFADEFDDRGPYTGASTEARMGGGDTLETPESGVPEVAKQEAVIAPYDTGYNKGYESGTREGAQTMYNSLLPGLNGYRDRYLNWRKYGLRGGGALLGASLGGMRGGALGTLFGGAAGWLGGMAVDNLMDRYNPWLNNAVPVLMSSVRNGSNTTTAGAEKKETV